MGKGVEVSDDDDEVAKKPAPPGEWGPAPPPVVFKDVSLQMKKQVPSAQSPGTEGINLSAKEIDSKFKRKSHRPQYSVLRRSFCTVLLHKLDGEAVEDAMIFDFVLGENFGYLKPEHQPTTKRWIPPKASRKVDVAQWVTEAALALEVGSSAEFKPVDTHSSGGLSCRCALSLLEASLAQDLLNDGSVLLRVLDSAPDGEKPRDLAQVSASWRVWFQRNNELILDNPASDQAPPDEEDDVALIRDGRKFVVDSDSLMVAFELGLKEMTCGSRACLRISEELGFGALLPGGTLVLKGAAIWIEVQLHSVENEWRPDEKSSVADTMKYALDKKQQGNDCMALQALPAYGRALRRYEAGIRTLTSLCGHGACSVDEDQHDLSKMEASPASEEKKSINSALTALQLNAAQAELKQSHWKGAIKFCELVLKHDEGNTKALYRRGLARAELCQYELAIGDIHAAAAASPTDAGIRRELARVEALRRDYIAGEKNTFGGVFEKMKQKEDERERREEARLKSEAEKEEKLAQEKAEADAKRAREMAAAEAERKKRVAEEEYRKAKEKVASGESSLSAPPVASLPPGLAGLGAKERAILEQLSGSGTPGVMPNIQRRETEKPPAVEYNVPSFLQRRSKKKSSTQQ